MGAKQIELLVALKIRAYAENGDEVDVAEVINELEMGLYQIYDMPGCSITVEQVVGKKTTVS